MYTTKMIWQGGEWWVSLLKDNQEVAYMSMAELQGLGAVQQAIEDAISDKEAAERAAAVAAGGRLEPPRRPVECASKRGD